MVTRMTDTLTIRALTETIKTVQAEYSGCDTDSDELLQLVIIELVKRGVTLDIHKCGVCDGSGLVPEAHDYATEWLGCTDCNVRGYVFNDVD